MSGACGESCCDLSGGNPWVLFFTRSCGPTLRPMKLVRPLKISFWVGWVLAIARVGCAELVNHMVGVYDFLKLCVDTVFSSTLAGQTAVVDTVKSRTAVGGGVVRKA